MIHRVAAEYQRVCYARDDVDPHAAVNEPLPFDLRIENHPEHGDFVLKKGTPRGIAADALEEAGRAEDAAKLRSAGRVFNGDDEVIHKEKYPQFAHGGAEIVQIMGDGGILCHQCANENQHQDGDVDRAWRVVGSEPHLEGDPIYCDHCGHDIESLYGNPDGE